MEPKKIVTIDPTRCTRCGICIDRFKDYCISEHEGRPMIDYRVCKICQKCVALCPSQAILVNKTMPEKITGESVLKPSELLQLLNRRRSIKIFREEELPKDIIQNIINAAKFAPNQNKNIDVLVITEKDVIEFIDRQAFKVFTRIYRFMFSIKLITIFLKMFSSDLQVIKKKMEYDLMTRKKIIKQGTQAMILLIGERKVPVTEMSAQYLLATMHIFAESLGVGSCLMDSIKMAANMNAGLRNRLKIQKGLRVLGVLVLGYPAEKIVNIPRGYELNVRWI